MTSAALVESGGAGLGDLVGATLRDHLGGRDARVVVLAMSKDENPKATVIAFPADARTPRLAVKVALTHGARASVAAEADALRRLAEADPTLVGGTVPRLLDERQDAAAAVIVTSAHRGVPMSIDYHRWRHTSSARRVTEDFEHAARWLSALGRTTVPGQDERTRTSSSFADALVARWPSDPAARAVADGVRQAVSELAVGCPSSVVHGDFWAGNILRHAGAVAGVIDWEHATFADDPLRDRARFALSYARYRDRPTRAGRRVAGHHELVAGPWGEGVRYALGGSGWFPTLVQRFLADGLDDTGRDPQLWRRVVLLGLAEIAATSDHPEFAHSHLLLGAEVLRWL